MNRNSNPQTQAQSNDTGQPLDAWKAYIRILQQLETSHPDDYEKVPEILKRYEPEEIRNLTDENIEALRNINALPTQNPPPVEAEDLRKTRTYIHTLQKFIGSPEFSDVPPVIQIICQDDEAVDNLDASHLQAMILMNVFPKNMFPQVNQKTEPSGPYFSHPYGTKEEPQEQIPSKDKEPNLSNQISDAKQDRNLAQAAAQIGELYSEGAAAIMSSIFESNNKMGEAFKRAGG